MFKRKRLLFLLGIIFIGFILFAVKDTRDVFKGDSKKTADSYSLQFEEMNQRDSHILSLERNDVLFVEFYLDHGYMDLSIGKENDKPIYKGNNVVDGKFEVIVQKKGNYKIIVKATHASGTINIIKKTN